MRKNRARSKLKSQSGETLTEVLVALLISALALTMLAAVISAAGKMITKSMDSMETYVEEENKIASREGEGVSGETVTVRIGQTDTEEGLIARKLTDADTAYIEVKYFTVTGFGKTKVISYAKK